MLSRRTKFFALIALLTAALVPGAAVYVPSAYACTILMPSSPAEPVASSEVIVVGRVESIDSSGMALVPEAFLKGPASGDALHFAPNPIAADCGGNPLTVGDRAIVYVADAANPVEPLINGAFILRDGHATMGDQVRTEVEVVSAIRSLTGQYAVPAVTQSEGAGINWGQTIIPLGVVMAILLGIGLVLMRVWHRIDPS